MTQELLVTERAREFCYKLLSVCYQLPRSEWKSDGILDELSELLTCLDSSAATDANNLRNALQEKEDILDLQVEYAKLFVGPYELLAPPYGSIYLENKRQVMGESTMAALEFYREVGIGMSDEVKEVPDHIKVQLELMYYLTFKEGQAVRKGDLPAAAQYANWQKQFINKFLGEWVLSFTGKLAENANQDFYQYLAKVTTAFMKEELARFAVEKRDH